MNQSIQHDIVGLFQDRTDLANFGRIRGAFWKPWLQDQFVMDIAKDERPSVWVELEIQAEALEVEEGAAMKKSQHVVPTTNGGWAVRKSGAARASKLFANQQEAVSYAKHLAEQAGSAMYIHRSDGTVQGRSNFTAGQTSPKA